jgi:N-glycosylase/DNA lyase
VGLININEIKVPPEIYTHYNSYRKKQSSWKKWYDLSEEEIWINLVFCILSSNIDSTLALSALDKISKKNMLQINWLVSDQTAYEVLSSELGKPQFFPRKKDGTLRKYRFPRIRAKNIVDAAIIIQREKIIFKQHFQEEKNEKKQRLFIIETIPGVGYKQATHFLRNIGYSNSLAIIDTHILSFLSEVHVNNSLIQQTFSPKTYEDYEELFLNLSKNLNLEPALFDYAIWAYMKRKVKK